MLLRAFQQPFSSPFLSAWSERSLFSGIRLQVEELDGRRIELKRQFEPGFAERQESCPHPVLGAKRIGTLGHTFRNSNVIRQMTVLGCPPLTAPLKFARTG